MAASDNNKQSNCGSAINDNPAPRKEEHSSDYNQQDDLGLIAELDGILTVSDIEIFNDSIVAFSSFLDILPLSSISDTINSHGSLLSNLWRWTNSTEHEKSQSIATLLSVSTDLNAENEFQHNNILALFYISNGCYKHVDTFAAQLKMMKENNALFLSEDVKGLKLLVSLIGSKCSVFIDKPIPDITQFLQELKIYLIIIFNIMHTQINHERLYVDIADTNILVILMSLLPLLSNVFKTHDIIKTLLCVIHKVMLVGFASTECLAALKEHSRIMHGLSSYPISKNSHGQLTNIKCTPKDVYQHYCTITARYPGLIIPTVSEICGQDVWLGEMPLSPATKRACQYGEVNLSSYASENGLLPVHVKDILEVIKRTLYVPLYSVQIAQISKEFRFSKEYGRGPTKTKQKSSASPYDNVAKLYKTLLSSIKPTIGALSLLIYYSNISSKSTGPDTLSDKRTNDIITTKCLCIIVHLLKMLKSYHILAYEYICNLMMDNNSLLLLLKVLCNWFPDAKASKSCKNKSPKRSTMQENRDGMNSLLDSDAKPTNLFAELCGMSDRGFYFDSYDQNFRNNQNFPSPHLLATCHRSVQSTISALSILQKLTKNKTSRISTLLKFKSIVVLKRIFLLARNPLLFQKTAKIIKSQLPFIGKKWKLANMDIISKVYLECGMTLTDDWMGNITVGGIDKNNKTSEVEYDVYLETFHEIDKEIHELCVYWHSTEHSFDIERGAQVEIGFDDSTRAALEDYEFESEYLVIDA